MAAAADSREVLGFERVVGAADAGSFADRQLNVAVAGASVDRQRFFDSLLH